MGKCLSSGQMGIFQKLYRTRPSSLGMSYLVMEPLCIRAQWKKLFFSFNFWYTFFPVFFNSKTGLFSCIFWSEASFFCKFSCLCLHSGFTWQSPAKYIGWPKKYLSVRNMQIFFYQHLFQNLNSLYFSNSGISRWCVTLNLHIYYANIFFWPPYIFCRTSPCKSAM